MQFGVNEFPETLICVKPDTCRGGGTTSRLGRQVLDKVACQGIYAQHLWMYKQRLVSVA